MAPPSTTFALVSALSTPHAAFFAFHAEAITKGILSRSSATDTTHVNIADLPEGPLKSLLTRTADWTTTAFKRRVIVKLSLSPQNSADTLPFGGGSTQSEGASTVYAASEIQFTSGSSVSAATAYQGLIEIRLVHSKVL